MASTMNTARSRGVATTVASKMAPRNYDRKPLQSIDANVAATRVQPPRDAKKKQNTSDFEIFDDERLEDRNRLRETTSESEICPTTSYEAPASTRTTLMDIDEEFDDDFSSETNGSPISMDLSPSSDNEEDAEEVASIYTQEIYQHLLSREKINSPKPRYMAKQADINHSMRTILVDWLVEVCDELQLNTETLYIAVNLIDRFLSKMAVLRTKLQLVGAAALFVASKYEEIYPPGVKEFIYLTDDCYTVDQLFRMEDLLLRVLDYDVSCPTPSFFLSQINLWTESDEMTIALSQYLVELGLTKGEFWLNHASSVVSAAAVCVSKHILGHLPWTDHVREHTGYSQMDLQRCARDLCDIMAAAAKSEQQAVRDKYTNVKYMEVALLNPSSSYPF